MRKSFLSIFLSLILLISFLVSCAPAPSQQQDSSTITISSDKGMSNSVSLPDSEPPSSSLSEEDLRGLVEVMLSAIPLDGDRMTAEDLTTDDLSMFAVCAYFYEVSPYHVSEENREYVNGDVLIKNTMCQQVIYEVFGISDFYGSYFQYDEEYDGYIIPGRGLPYFYIPINESITQGENGSVVYTCDYEEPAYGGDPLPPVGTFDLHFQLMEENGQSFNRFLFSEKIS